MIQERIAEIAARWERMIDLPGIDITHVYVNSTNDDDVDTAATTSTAWIYRQAEIKWYLTACAGMDDEGLELVVIHELVHVLLATLKDRLKAGSDEHCEHATENVARALLAVRNATRGDL